MKKILIIDDEEKIRTAYRVTLAKEGFEVLEAKDAAQGISEMFRNEDTALFLFDIKMPEMSGSRVMNIVEDYELHFKIIVSSVYPVDEQKYLIPEADDYFDKVQGVDVLIEKIKRVLGVSRMNDISKDLVMKRRSILIIDSKWHAGSSWKKALSNKYEVIVLEDADILEVCREEMPQAVIINSHLHKEFDLNIFRSMKRSFPSLSIIVVISYRCLWNRDELKKWGIEHVVIKPATIESFEEKIEEVLCKEVSYAKA